MLCGTLRKTDGYTGISHSANTYTCISTSLWVFNQFPSISLLFTKYSNSASVARHPVLLWKYFFFTSFSLLPLSPTHLWHLWYVQFCQSRVKTGKHWEDCVSQVWEWKSFPMKTSVSVQVMPSYPPKEMFWLTFLSLKIAVCVADLIKKFM